MPDQAGDFLDADAWRLSRLTKEVRSSRGVHLSPMPAWVATRLNIFRTLAASRAAPWWVVKTSPVSCQPSPACEPLIGLAVGPSAQCLDCGCGEGEGAAGSFGFGFGVRAD